MKFDTVLGTLGLFASWAREERAIPMAVTATSCGFLGATTKDCGGKFPVAPWFLHGELCVTSVTVH